MRHSSRQSAFNLLLPPTSHNSVSNGWTLFYIQIFTCQRSLGNVILNFSVSVVQKVSLEEVEQRPNYQMSIFTILMVLVKSDTKNGLIQLLQKLVCQLGYVDVCRGLPRVLDKGSRSFKNINFSQWQIMCIIIQCTLFV